MLKMCYLRHPCGYFAVVFSMIQIFLHGAVCSLAVLMHNCHFLPQQLDQTYYIYFTYLYNDKCKENLKIDFGTQVQLPVVAKEAEVLVFVLETFVGLSIMWLLASLALFCGMCCRVRDRWAIFYYFPWITVGLLLTVLDAFCTAKYGLQLLRPLSTRGWLEYVGADAAGTSDVYDERFAKSVLLASLFFVRFGAVFVNCSLIINVYSSGRDAYTGSDSEEGAPRTHSVTNNNNPVCKSQFQTAEERIRRWQDFYQSETAAVSAISPGGGGDASAGSPAPVRGDLPWTYAENVGEIRNQRTKLVCHSEPFLHGPPRVKDLRRKNVVHTGEDLTSF